MGARRRRPRSLPAGRSVLVVGLPGRRVPQALGYAHRPSPRIDVAGRAVVVGPDRPQRSQGGEAVRPRPAGCGIRASYGRPMTESLDARRRLAEATRLVMERMVASTAPADMLEAAAERMEAFAEMLAEYPYGRTYEGFAEPANSPRPEEFFDHSPVSGRANPVAAPMKL